MPPKRSVNTRNQACRAVGDPPKVELIVENMQPNDRVNAPNLVAGDTQSVQQQQPDLSRLLQTQTGFVEHIEQQQLEQHVPSPSTVLEVFLELTTATFNGEGGVEAADYWIQQMEKTFEVMQCSDGNKVFCAAFMLQQGAYDWWLLEKLKHEDDRETPYTWEMLKASFYDKYFPLSERIRMETEFIKLVQGNKTVAEYGFEFTRLSKFAPLCVATEESRARRFEKGLNFHIKKVVMLFELKTYWEVFNKALLVERLHKEEEDVIAMESNQRKRQGEGEGDDQSSSSKSTSRPGKRRQTITSHFNSRNQQNTTSVCCPRCGHNHAEKDCRWATGACFACGKQGHKVADCFHARTQG